MGLLSLAAAALLMAEIRLVMFFAAKDGEALYSQQKQDWELTVAQIMKSLQGGAGGRRPSHRPHHRPRPRPGPSADAQKAHKRVGLRR